jgi:hypothetical protein
MAGIEKRKERRIKITLPIRIIYQGAESSGLTGNISRLGAYAEVDRELPIGADVEAVLEIPVYTKDSSLTGKTKCKGNIFRSNFIREARGKKYWGSGIFFTGFAEVKDKERLSRYIDYLIAQEERDIKKGARLWSKKRRIRKIGKALTEDRADNSDIAALLKQILSQLEDIRSLLKPPSKNR